MMIFGQDAAISRMMMVVPTRVKLLEGKQTVMANLYGPMDRTLKENLKMANYGQGAGISNMTMV